MHLDLAHDAFSHGLIVEASAGTGKTYSVAAIVTRELALREDLRIGQILITTFTQNAAAELRDRVRRRLVETTRTLRGADATGDEIAARLRDGTDAEIADRIRRLERALVEFDSATISTIHGVCSRVLRTAGIDAGRVTDTDEVDRIVEEMVNDLVVSHSTADHRWDEAKVGKLVKAMLGDPLIEPWVDPNDDGLTAADRTRLDSLGTLLRACVDRIHAAMAAAPGYNDLLRMARELVCDEARPELLAALRSRFRLAIVDEAQDTDRQQWRFFERLFPGGDGRALVSVGDPKQAIYGFRGADVRAYVDHAAAAKADPATRAALYRTLPVNRRTDQPLLDALNAAFDGQEFGAGIEYLEVHAPKNRQASLIRALSSGVEFVAVDGATSQIALVRPVLGKVIELLDDARLAEQDDPTGKERLLDPRDICVLVRSSGVGRLVERALGRHGIPAVMGGTSSVMSSGMALDLRSLLEAMEQPWNVEQVIEEVQDGLVQFAGILAKKGIAALGAAIEADEAIMTRIASGRQGERNVTDFLHVMEVMDAQGPGRGRTPAQALEIFSRLAAMDEKHDLVSRRVESDADAVKILTIHAAKGLEFPCVIVADLWKDSSGWSGGEKKPAVFYDDDGIRKLDLGHALDHDSARAKRRRQAAEDEESRRLLYVACTRAEHYLAILVARGKPDRNGNPPRPSILEQTMKLPQPCAAPNGRTKLVRQLGRAVTEDGDLRLAPPAAVTRTYRRMSFTGITAVRGHGRDNPFDPEGGGYDEPSGEGGISLPPLSAAAAASLPVIDLPAGIAVGRVIHEIFEHVDTTQRPLEDEVRRVVTERATAGRLRSCHDGLVRIVTDSLETPLGGPFGELTFAHVPPRDRLAEMDFDMGLASLTAGVQAKAIGEVLAEMLPVDDPLRGYAATLAGPAFEVDVGGLLTGSIDALLRLPESTPDRPRLLICDYKSNKLHRTGMPDPLRAYAPDRLVAAMEEHHYPLQALLYGTAVYRMLRWRLPKADPDDCIAGVAYAFIRGMKGSATPIDARGHRFGVFAWQPPRGLFRRLSDVLVTPRLTGATR